MWSLACVCSEMYLGLPLFPGVSQHNQLSRIVGMMGPPPDIFIEGKNGPKYYKKIAENSSSHDGSSTSSRSRKPFASMYNMSLEDTWELDVVVVVIVIDVAVVFNLR